MKTTFNQKNGEPAASAAERKSPTVRYSPEPLARDNERRKLREQLRHLDCTPVIED